MASTYGPEAAGRACRPSRVFPKLQDVIVNFTYQSLRTILNIKANPKKLILFQSTLGVDPTVYVKLLAENDRERLTLAHEQLKIIV